MTAGLSIFDHPFFLGFDQFERDFDQIKKNAEGYPPYNVEQVSDEALRITLAVAGFAMEDLDIELDRNHLIIRGKQAEDKDRIFLHRGIAARQFQRVFMIADGIEVKGATLDNGLLNIDMVRVEPERVVRKIEIANTGARGRNEIVDVKGGQGK